MPFDVLPQETQVEVGPFQADADAMLRGCAVTAPCFYKYFERDAQRKIYAACALGAWRVGMGLNESNFEREDKMRRAYSAVYGNEPQEDYDTGNFTREQIAERIAALR